MASERRDRPRIVIIADYPPDLTTFSSGVQTATAGLLEGLEPYQSEFDFHVVSLTRSIPRDLDAEHAGFRFHFLSLPTVRWLPTRAPFRVLKIRRMLRRLRPALVHCNANSFAPLAVISGGYRRVLTIHGVSGHEAHLRTGRVLGNATADVLLERYVHSHFPAFICISRYAATVVGQQRLTFAIPNPVGSLFLVDRGAATPDDQVPRLLFVGVLAPLKRPLDLLLAHAELRREIPELQTILCGHTEDAGYAHQLRRLIADRGISGVRLIEHASRAEVFDLLRSAAVFVLPSAQENAPMSIAEAMAVGVPVVATRVGGVPEMVQDGVTGFLYAPGDVPRLTQHLRHLLGDPGLRARFAQAARHHALTTYAPAVVGRATAGAYRQLLG